MKNINVLRTPEERFENLPDYLFEPHYEIIDNIRVHYLDEGSTFKNVVLLLHGEPSWSYLYRKMIQPLMDAGYRVITPDLMGFGKSDKPVRTKDYTYQKHVDLIHNMVKKLDLSNMTLFCQDWGGLIGLRVVAEEPDRFNGVIAANTSLPHAQGFKAMFNPILFKLKVRLEGNVDRKKFAQRPDFFRWVAYSKTVPILPIGDIINGGTVKKLSEDVIKAYEAPFPDERYKAGARIFPMLVPTQLKENHKAWEKVLFQWKKPFLTAFSDHDPITKGMEKYFQKKIPGAKNQEHVTIKDAGHFLQEDKGEELAELLVKFNEKTT